MATGRKKRAVAGRSKATRSVLTTAARTKGTSTKRSSGPVKRKPKGEVVAVVVAPALKAGKNKKGRKGKKANLPPVTFKVRLEGGRVVCTPKSGNRLVRRGENRGICWEVQQAGNQPAIEFELVFRRVEFDGAGDGSTDWPFDSSSSPRVGTSSTGRVTSFQGVLRADPNAWTAYKYDVIVYEGSRATRLDPMIIIGKL